MMYQILLMMAALLLVASGQAFSSEVYQAPMDSNVTDHRKKSDPNITDHRKANEPNVTDHRKKSDPNVTDHRKKSDTNVTDHRPATSTVPSKESPISSGLVAPSGLVVSDITRTTLTLSWVDNSNREFGVELYRVDPVEARRNRANSWKKIGTFEERNQSNVTGKGMRSDEDFDLSPGTNYCYRMRAYSGFDRSEVSDYSEVVCTMTSQ
jgi:hypothetical protein